MSDNLAAVIGRLDSICNLLHRMAAVGQEEKWPEDLLAATEKLANDVTNLTGALDSADRNTARLRDLIAAAHLQDEFAAFGKALADEISRAVG